MSREPYLRAVLDHEGDPDISLTPAAFAQRGGLLGDKEGSIDPARRFEVFEVTAKIVETATTRRCEPS